MRVLLAAVATSLLAFVAQADVVVLDESNFDQIVDGSQNVFVEFYAPWCGHCKSLEPEYDIAGATYKAGDGVVIAKVDADAHRKLGERFDVKGFPTLKWFPKGSTKPEEYNGPRDAEGIVAFVNGKTGLTRKVKKLPSAVVDLTTSNFDSIALDPSKAVLVEFFAPWCGHCKSLVPIYEKLAKVFQGEKEVVVAKVDATEQRELAERFGVSGYPTIKFFPKGPSGEPQNYEGARQLKDFVEFINEKAGTLRTADGGLLEKAGRVDVLDTMVASGPVKKSTLDAVTKAASGLEGKAAEYGKHYVNAVKKILEKGPSYVDMELARLHKLTEGAVSADKKTLFLIRSNVLKAFKPKSTEEL